MEFSVGSKVWLYWQPSGTIYEVTVEDYHYPVYRVTSDGDVVMIHADRLFATLSDALAQLIADIAAENARKLRDVATNTVAMQLLQKMQEGLSGSAEKENGDAAQ